MGRPIVDLTGRKFGKYTVLRLHHIKNHIAFWKVKCDCGNIRYVTGGSLKNGLAKSCGCYSKEMKYEWVKRHGMSRTVEYKAWGCFIARCYNPHNASYKWYGGNGIRVCLAYRNYFEYFFSDLGLRPTPKHSVDRIDSDLNYSCGKCSECVENGWKMNVQWATYPIQARNRSNNVWLEYNGRNMILTDWATELKTTASALGKYLNGHSLHEAILHYSLHNH